MPYIDPERKVELLSQANFPKMEGPGELNYWLTQTLLFYLVHQDNTNYQAFNDILGAVEGAKLEFYRRVVVPYEEKKRAQNGDVY